MICSLQQVLFGGSNRDERDERGLWLIPERKDSKRVVTRIPEEKKPG